jgi:hypothetical protein
LYIWIAAKQAPFVNISCGFKNNIDRHALVSPKTNIKKTALLKAAAVKTASQWI